MKNMRLGMEAFARSRHLDPLLPETWYNISRATMRQHKSGRAILEKFRGYFDALQNLFPEIGLDRITFSRYLWRDDKKRRKFFENYAKEKGFDPNNPESWYSQSRENIVSTPGASGVLFYHKRSVSKALLDLFPDIGLDKLKSDLQYSKCSIGYRRRFFETYAKVNGFDANDPEKWYLQSRAKIMSSKGARGVMVHYGGSVVKALLYLFSNIGLDKSKLINLWHDATVRKKFFENFAIDNGFDPHNPENWYTQSRERIMAVGGRRVMEYYNGSLAKALIDVYPNIGLDEAKFSYARCSIAKRRKFFENYAKTNAFDPQNPYNWYSQTSAKIMSFKGASRVLSYYNKSFSQALVELFPNIGLEKEKFRSKYGPFNEENRRQHFLDFAKENDFDPQKPENWYSQNKSILIQRLLRVLSYYDFNVTRALLELFPNIGFEKSKFKGH